MTLPCILWTGYTQKSGHGQTWRNGKQDYVHRLAYIDAYGPIPPGLQINHHCDRPNCIEPTHLYAGTQQDNIRDMNERGRHRGPPKQAYCKRGHEKTPENTYRGACLTCKRASTAIANAKRYPRSR